MYAESLSQASPKPAFDQTRNQSEKPPGSRFARRFIRTTSRHPPTVSPTGPSGKTPWAIQIWTVSSYHTPG